MKKVLALVITLVMAFTVFSAVNVYADEIPEITYSAHMTNNSDVGYDYDISGSSIAWVKQATGVLIWVDGDDTRTDDEIFAQASGADHSLSGCRYAVLKGVGTAKTPNTNGSKATVTVSVAEGKTILSIDGKYSHFVSANASSTAAAGSAAESATESSSVVANGEKVSIRIDAPLKMAVAFADGEVYYGGEMKEVVVGEEYAFQMCSVNWENGIYDGNDNGIRGTVVYRMKVVHQNEFNELARAAKANPERYTVKGMDIIDNESKTIIINCDASDAHLETDVNNFFVAYRFHFTGSDYNKKTGIDKVINKPVESLSVNLPAGSTISCKAFVGDDMVDSNNVFVTTNSGEGEYDNEYLTSVNDYTWSY